MFGASYGCLRKKICGSYSFCSEFYKTEPGTQQISTEHELNVNTLLKMSVKAQKKKQDSL